MCGEMWRQRCWCTHGLCCELFHLLSQQRPFFDGTEVKCANRNISHYARMKNNEPIQVVPRKPFFLSSHSALSLVGVCRCSLEQRCGFTQSHDILEPMWFSFFSQRVQWTSEAIHIEIHSFKIAFALRNYFHNFSLFARVGVEAGMSGLREWDREIERGIAETWHI